MSTTDEKIYRRLHDWLLAHIQSFAIAGEAARHHFDLKRTHSLKVAEEIGHLGRALGLASRPLLIARVIGLLHDAGRFEQYDRYRTFNDAVSTDHGALGVSVVSSNGLLAAFDSSEVQVITEAILHHNKLALPEKLSGEALFFLKLVRDADKLDIYRVIMEDMAAADQALFKVLMPGNEDASEEVATILMRGGGVKHQLARNATDRLLMHVGWVFDINFPPTLRAIADRGYLEAIAACLPHTFRVTQIITKARNHLAATLADGPTDPPAHN